MDTSAFYTDEERDLQNAIYRMKSEMSPLKSEKKILTALKSGKMTVEVAKKQFGSIYMGDKQVGFVFTKMPPIAGKALGLIRVM